MKIKDCSCFEMSIKRPMMKNDWSRLKGSDLAGKSTESLLLRLMSWAKCIKTVLVMTSDTEKSSPGNFFRGKDQNESGV